MAIRKRISNLSDKDRKAVNDYIAREESMKLSLREQAEIPVESSREYYKGLMRKGRLGKPNTLDVSDLLEMARTVDNPGNETEEAARHRIKSPLTGIRAFCVMCVGGLPGEVRKCSDMACSFWLFRFGTNPMYGRTKKGNS